MENVFINKEIKFLNAIYCIHIFTFIFIWVIYLAMHENIYWIFDYSILLFEISLYVFLSFTFLLMILFFVFTCAKMVEKKIKIIIKITVVFFILSIINSLFCSVISCYNSTLFKSFYLNCPFNYNIEDIPMMIDKANISERMRKNFVILENVLKLIIFQIFIFAILKKKININNTQLKIILLNMHNFIILPNFVLNIPYFIYIQKINIKNMI